MLVPREHGAYGQVGFPIAASIAAGHFTVAGLALTAGFVAAFLAHESLLVLLGARGQRARRERRETAIRIGTSLSIVAVVGVSIGAALMPVQDRWTILVPAACAAGIFALALRHLEKSTTGEMFVALACASCALPVGAACGIPPRAATLIWLVMTLGYWAATAAVRGTIAVQRRESHAVLRFSGAVLAIAAPPTVLMAGQALVLRPLIWTAALPLSILSLALAVAPPHARHLRRVGWGLIAASALSAVLLAVFLRQ
jgi:YwiC-like protein